jgi:hypothetical protein
MTSMSGGLPMENCRLPWVVTRGKVQFSCITW